VVGSRSGGRLGEDPNPNRDGTENRLLSLDRFFVLGRFVDLDVLEKNDAYRRKADLEIQLGKIYDMMGIDY
jgi:hypothetical protein